MGPAGAAVVLVIVALGCLLLPGWMLRGQRRGAILATATLGSALLVAWTLWGRDRPWVADLAPGSGVAIGSRWSLPLAALVIGSAWSALPGPWWRRGLLSTCCLVLAAFASLGFLLGPTPHCDNVWDDDVCLQTTPSTCSPAAAATLLARCGVRSTEAALASACFTTPKGTSLAGLVGGLRRYAPPDLRVRTAQRSRYRRSSA